MNTNKIICKTTQMKDTPCIVEFKFHQIQSFRYTYVYWNVVSMGRFYFSQF